MHVKEVHWQVSELIRKRDVAKAFQVDTVEEEFAQIIEKFKKKVMEQHTPTPSSSFRSDMGNDIIATDRADIREALDYVHEIQQDREAEGLI